MSPKAAANGGLAAKNMKKNGLMINVMKHLAMFFVLSVFALAANAQTYIKLNGLYALAGVVNPAVEFPLSERSTFQAEIVVSPWTSVTLGGRSGPMRFGIFLNEYRRYFGERNRGWYLGANAGGMAFHMTKPYWERGVRLQQKSAKGYGMMFGAAIGRQWRLGERWLIDAFFGWSFTSSFYNGYSLVDGLVEGGRIYNKGELILRPAGHEHDPFNGSAEWLPNKIGVSIGYRIGK